MDQLKLAQLFAEAEKNPTEAKLQYQVQQELRKHLPSWHLPMLYDEARNQFYEHMIRRNVEGKVVFEIGTGTGFLALTAAQAGAKHIYACEMNPLFQFLSQNAINESGLQSKVTILSMNSTDVKIGRDIPEPVDVIVSEIIATDIFSEEMIFYLRDARRLLKPDGIFLPGFVEVWACLVESNHGPEHTPTPFTSTLEKMSGRLPRFHHSKVWPVSRSQKIATLRNGFEFDHLPPWQIQFDRTSVSPQTALCLSFKLVEPDLVLSSMRADAGVENDRQTETLHASSWGQMLYPLSQRESYQLTIHLLDETHVVVTER